MLRNYFKIAVRNLLRNKVFSFINVAGLALGLSCCMLIVLYTKDERSFDQFQENKDRLYRVTVSMTGEKESTTIGSTNSIHGPTFQEEIPEIEAIIRMQSSSFVTRKDNELLNQEVVFVDDNFFSVFSMPLLTGNPKTALADVNSIVLSEDLAHKYFGTKDAVGKTIDLKIGESFETFTVSGVARRSPQNSSIQFDALLPFKFQETRGWLDNEWLGFYMNTFVLLHEKADYLSVVPKLDRVFYTKAREELSRREGAKPNIHFDLQPFLDIHQASDKYDLHNGLAHGSKPIYSYILTGIALFILLIACINFVNLTVARSLKRGKEIGIRKVVGSLRKQLVYQFLGESLLLSFVAFSLAIGLTLVVLPTFNELANKQLALSYLLDAGLVSTYVALFLLTALIAGFYPALVLSGFNPVQTLYNRTKLTHKNYLTKGLVVFQFALSVCLVIGTIVIYSQFDYLVNKDLGYNDEHLLSFSLGRGRGEPGKLAVLKQELEAISGVESVAAFNGDYNGTNAQVNGQEISFGYIGVDDNFLPTLQIPVLRGRNFSQRFPSDPAEAVIVNEAFVKEAGWQEPIGQEIDFTWKNQKMKVIGVIRDYHYASLREKIAPLLLTQDPNYGLRTIYVKLQSQSGTRQSGTRQSGTIQSGTDIPETVKAIESTFRKYIPLIPFEYQFEDVTNAKRYEAEAQWRQVITWAAILSVFVSCIGLFGLATYSAETRIKEIGIRKVMGASASAIVALLSRDFVLLVLIAIVIAMPVAYYGASLWLENFPYRAPISWWYFAAAATLAMAVALLTVGYQSVRAALMNPVRSLRSE